MTMARGAVELPRAFRDMPHVSHITSCMYNTGDMQNLAELCGDMSFCLDRNDMNNRFSQIFSVTLSCAGCGSLSAPYIDDSHILCFVSHYVQAD